MSTGRVTGRKRDIDGNTARQASANPIIDTRYSTIDFEDGEVTELTSNEIPNPCMHNVTLTETSTYCYTL